MKNIASYKLFRELYSKLSVSTKVSAICGIGSTSIGIGEYLDTGIGIGENFGIGAALLSTLLVFHIHSWIITGEC